MVIANWAPSAIGSLFGAVPRTPLAFVLFGAGIGVTLIGASIRIVKGIEKGPEAGPARILAVMVGLLGVAILAGAGFIGVMLLKEGRL